MASVKDPVGPHDKRVYLRRRITVLGGLLAIVVVVLLIVFRPGSSGGVESAQEVSLPDDLTVQAAKDSDTKKAEDEAPGCRKSDIAVTAVANKKAYSPGENPEIWMTISNTGAKPCVIDLGTQEMVFEIKSGSELYWNSKDCQTAGDSREVILEPENPLSTAPLVWDRTRSAPDTCGVEGRPPVPANGASYHLSTSVNGISSADSWQFLLY